MIKFVISSNLLPGSVYKADVTIITPVRNGSLVCLRVRENEEIVPKHLHLENCLFRCHRLQRYRLPLDYGGTFLLGELLGRRPPEGALLCLSLIHISEPTRLGMISYAVFCLKKQ